MKKHLYLFGILFVAAIALVACGGGDDDNVQNVPAPMTVGYELPRPKGGSSIIVTHYAKLNDKSDLSGANYTIEWDTEKNAQRWSCYKYCRSLSASNVSRYYSTNDGSLSATCQYPNDPDLPEQYRFASGEDPYRYSGYDHGHIFPSADRLSSKDANYQTFYITNMQPQNNKFNAGVWSKMEGQVRGWLSYFDTLYVCKGGTIDKDDHVYEYVFQRSHQSTRVNSKHIPVPKYFFMAVLGRKGNTFKATGFWIDQTNYNSDIPKNYAQTIAYLQNMTGIDFFCNLPDDIEAEVENVSKAQMLSEWY